MKEIGEKLKEARENMGISIEEAAEDLKIRPAQIENIEDGDKDAFKDVFYLKFFIRDYAKYLGLDADMLIDEFNEYLFDYTSRLSLDDIKKASGQTKVKKKIVSPYTLERKQQRNIPPALIYGLIVFVIALIVYFIIVIATNTKEDNIVMNMEEMYEFA